MKNPVVSIIVPVYNVEAYVEKSLLSAVNQTFSNIEIVCVNDGSKDDSWNKVKKIAREDERIVLVNCSENHGLSYARNRGMEVAKGKYIMFLDSDDSLVECAVEIAYKEIEKKSLDMLIFAFQSEYESEEIKEKFYRPDESLAAFENNVYSGCEFVAACEKNNWPLITSWNMIYKREFLVKNELSFIEGIIHEDDPFVNDCILRAERIGGLNKILYKYYRRANSITVNKVTLNTVKSHFIIFCHLVKEFLENNYPREFYPYIGRRIASYGAKPYRSYIKSDSKIPFADIDYNDDWHKKAFSVFSCFQIIQTKWKISSEDLSEITRGKEIILYGAGEVARKAIYFLANNNINEFIVAVTRARDNEYIAGNRVYSINDVKAKDKSKVIVLVALSAIHQTKVIEQLRLMGYMNIVCMV